MVRVVPRRGESGRAVVGVLILVLWLALLGVWLGQGVYRLAPGENAAILRVGVYQRADTTSGWRWHWPPPFETHRIVDMQALQHETFGPAGPAPAQIISEEANPPGMEPAVVVANAAPATESNAPAVSEADDASLRARRRAAYAIDEAYWREVAMQTQDHSIVYVPFAVHYRVRDLAAYFQRVDITQGFVRDAAQAVMREEIARIPIAQLFEDRVRVQDSVRRALQIFFDRYSGSSVGIEVQSVQIQDLVLPAAAREAGEDVRLARQWKEQQLAEAKQYETAQRYRAKQYATQARESTAAYAVERVASAEARRTEFLQLLPVYRAAPEVTRRRLYLETMEAVLATTNTVVIEKGLPSVPSLLPRPEAQGAPAASPATK